MNKGVFLVYTADKSAARRHGDKVAARDKAAWSESRDIAEDYPEVKNPRRKAACRRSLQLFCEKYYPNQFWIPWSPDHITAIDRLQTTVMDGGQFAFAMPRGSGKTTLCQVASEWAILYGHRKFVVVIGATEAHSEDMLDDIRTDLETNDLLYEDFPEVCHPIRKLEGIVHRCNGQTFKGERTRMSWTTKIMVFPTMPKSKCAGSVVRVAGITGRIRGMKITSSDGKSIRPDLVIVDDPQTDDSATSPTQCDQRERILTGAVLGLAGPKVKIAAAVPCTVIAPDDLADRLLNRDRSPQWHGERTKMVYAFPTSEKLWEEYETIRRDSLKSGGDGTPATEFYRANQSAMDEGARVAWPERFSEGEASAIQHAMNLRMDRPGVFEAEYQNEPLIVNAAGDAVPLEADLIANRLIMIPRRHAPRESTRLTLGVDVGGEVHWYVVVAWDESFGGSVVDYGTWPPQNRTYFAADDPKPGLSQFYPGLSEEGRVYQGVVDLLRHVHGTDYRMDESGAPVGISRGIVDSGYIPESIYRAIRESGHKETTLPSKGKGIRPDENPMQFWAKRPGERRGWNWRIRPMERGKPRLVVFDSNEWKSFLAARLLVPFSSPGRLALFGSRPNEHRMFADHCVCEFRTRKIGRDRTIDMWELKPNRRDNHLWDATVLACVAASVDGLIWERGALAGAPVTDDPKRTPVKLSAIQTARRDAAPSSSNGGKARIKLSDLQRERRMARV